MIIDIIQNLDRYRSLNPHFSKVISFLREVDLHSLSPEKHLINGDAVFARVIERDHLRPEQLVLESHKKYIDLHITLSGCDRVGWCPVELATQKGNYVEATDDFFYDGKPQTWFDLPPEYAVIFFPGEAHLALAGAGQIKKIVIKIAV